MTVLVDDLARLEHLDPAAAEQIKRILGRLAEADRDQDSDKADVLLAMLAAELRWQPQAHQHAPPGEWWTWVFQGGRGTGKTATGSHWFDAHMRGPACSRGWPGGHKGVIVGPTHGDAVASCVKGETGLRAYAPDIAFVGRKDGSFVVWPNSAEAVILGMHTENDAERLRAQSANACTWWLEEAAIGRHLKIAADNLALGARGALHPHGIATTTPKNTAAYRAFLQMPGITVTKASSYDNKFLPESYRQLISHYEGSRLGQMEIHGELVDDYEGALWTREIIDADRIRDYPADPLERVAQLGLTRIAIGIDPSTWIPEVGTPENAVDLYEGGSGVETGLVVVGIDQRNPPHVYVLDDRSGRVAATEWARRAAAEYHTWQANYVVPETNAGGDLVLATIRLTDPSVAIYRDSGSSKPGVRASHGKRARAEPVAALYEQHRAHHVGEFPALESTLTGWDPTENWSPDRLDALVWAITALEPWRPTGAAESSIDLLRQSHLTFR